MSHLLAASATQLARSEGDSWPSVGQPLISVPQVLGGYDDSTLLSDEHLAVRDVVVGFAIPQSENVRIGGWQKGFRLRRPRNFRTRARQESINENVGSSISGLMFAAGPLRLWTHTPQFMNQIAETEK